MSCSAALSRPPGRSARVEGSPGPSPNGSRRPDLASFERERRQLLRVAYRLLGSSADAEDILQEAGIRWLRLGREREGIRNPGAYLTRLVTRLCLDVLRSGHSRCIRYVASPFPNAAADGQPGEPAEDPTELHRLVDDLARAFTVLMERLNPVERTVLLLREAFDFSYVEIARIVGKSIQNSRQIERRARVRVHRAGRRRWYVDVDRRARLVEAFLDATRYGDLDALLAVLGEDLATQAPSPPPPSREAAPGGPKLSELGGLAGVPAQYDPATHPRRPARAGGATVRPIRRQDAAHHV